MTTITNVTIEQSSKNILVDSKETIYDSEGTEIGTQNIRRGYNPSILDDWNDAEENEILKPYTAIAWAGLNKPTT